MEAIEQQAMIGALQRLLAAPSVKGEPLPGQPFGPGVARALEEALALCRELGLKTRCFDGYAGDATYEVPGATETVGVLCHLDVVPAGEGWRYEPFAGTVEGGRIYGRGVVDDKGPAVAALFGWQALLKGGFQPRRNLRFIFGCDEESGWACMEHYQRCVPMPDLAIVPDGDFPVIHAEKGILHLELHAALQGCPVWARAGSRANVVPDRAEARVAGETLRATGRTAHGAHPEQGENAIARVVDQLAVRRDLGSAEPFIAMLRRCIGHEIHGEGLGLGFADEVSGRLTLNLGLLDIGPERASAVVDIRYPVTCPRDRVLEAVRGAVAPYGCDVAVRNDQAALYIDRESPLIRTLMEAFAEEVGAADAQPLAIGGGTYARAMANAAAFGPEWGDHCYGMHGPNENMEVAWLAALARIYAGALRRLAG